MPQGFAERLAGGGIENCNALRKAYRREPAVFIMVAVPVEQVAASRRFGALSSERIKSNQTKGIAGEDELRSAWTETADLEGDAYLRRLGQFPSGLKIPKLLAINRCQRDQHPIVRTDHQARD